MSIPVPDLSALDLSHLAPVDRVVMEEYLRRKKLRSKANSFLSFAKHVYPTLVVEEVHVLIAAHFEMLRNGEIDRLMIMMPPRTGKSLLTSELLPAWWEGHMPMDKMLHASYASTLVEKFGRKIRNMLTMPEYHEIFPDTRLSKDSKASDQWSTTKGGEYNAVGVGGGVAGKGGNLMLIDDPVNEQDMFSKSAHNGVYEWYGAGFYSRRQPDRNAIILTMTRWRVDDLVGRLLADAVTNPGADQWTVLKIPAIVDEETADLLNECSTDPHITTPHHYKVGDSFSPRRWSLEELNRTKATITRKAWASLYLQSPTEEEGGILLRDWWKPWKEDKPLPECEYILQSYDTAFEEGEANDYSARITWGVFKRPSDGKMCAIMLERLKERLSFPLLLDNALVSYEEYKPDRIVVEKAASGIPLIQEMRKRGIPVTPVKPVGSKIARANAATILLEQGVIYYPDRKWARDVIDECAEFPNGPHDDTCFVAGTLVATPQGERRIEDISVGDEVTTPFGSRRVLSAKMTGVRRVREYGLRSGRKLVGTPDHPVFSGNSFIAIDKLSPSNKLVSNILPEGRQSWYLSLKVWFGLRLWSLKGVSIGGIQILRERMRGGILGGLGDFYIGMFGRHRMVQSPQSTTFTTSMVTQETIGSRTWNWCPRESTFKSTEHQSEGSVQSNWHILQSSEIRQERGTHLQKGTSGISSMQQKQALIKEATTHLRCVSWFVRNARKSIARKLHDLSIVALAVSVKRVIVAVGCHLFVWTGYVRNVVKNLWGKGGTRDSVRSGAENDFIISSDDHVAERVFNLQVEEVSCYYANGILVHNCDAVVHGLNFLRRMFLLDTPADEEDEEKPEEYDPAVAQTQRSYARRQSRLTTHAR